MTTTRYLPDNQRLSCVSQTTKNCSDDSARSHLPPIDFQFYSPGRTSVQKPGFFENTRSQCTDSAKNPVSLVNA
ncbi:hypothetical protein [Microcoleus sp. PH2017_28_MFU_U_A]|uniref:hypothetical protein n=1 Tax=Microcoleus sp. PH2017_28_MFU_U_A TaxID=2798838 RepID=UPI001DD74263|nr:hypothetical protein [Microcoleus sp. PH2017_28_MFU_U_A]MCC3592918.1 hypothetical protein [Microcoleus sp. PH2017_28_MFU_U_A]